MSKPIADRSTERTAGLQCYQVGGAVRDALLGLPVQDRDWVVVGSTPDDMIARGFMAVGRDFPVFLHPETHEEYALARTERKSGQGYRGFVVHCAPDVTLEDDLLRRDLTVNAMALAPDGQIIDPYGGQKDLASRLLRHVSPAFIEDPVRILRVARFCARFGQFKVAPETLELMRAMVDRGEVDALVPERIWQELSRGLMQPHAPRMIDLLAACGAAQHILPGLAPCWTAPDLPIALACTVDAQAALEVRWAVLLHRMSIDEADALQDAVRAPQACRDLARLLIQYGSAMLDGTSDPALALTLLERCDALRKPERFAALLQALRCTQTAQGQAVPADKAARVIGAWQEALVAARSVQAGPIAQAVATEPIASRSDRIRAAVSEARCTAIAQAWSKDTGSNRP
ncbi:MAG: hypothetical protein ACO26U_11000 [Burkholderiaceae bacterium]